MSIYRERVIAYAIIGAIALALGFAAETYAAQIVQPAVWLWVSASILVTVPPVSG